MTDSHNTQDKSVVSSGSIFDPLWSEAESEPMVEYRSLSLSALLTLIFGVLSLTMVFHWGFFFIPILTLFFGIISLQRFRASGNMLFGKSMIGLGLFFSLFFCCFYFVSWFVYEQVLISQARAFAPLVFETLKTDDIPAFLDIKRARFSRAKRIMDKEERWATLGKHEMEVESINGIANDKLVRTMIALGDDAEIAFYKVIGIYHLQSPEVALMYSVTYPGKDGKETFFLNLWMSRSSQDEQVQGKTVQQVGWLLKNISGPVLPKEMGGTDSTKKTGQ